MGILVTDWNEGENDDNEMNILLHMESQIKTRNHVFVGARGNSWVNIVVAPEVETMFSVTLRLFVKVAVML